MCCRDSEVSDGNITHHRRFDILRREKDSSHKQRKERNECRMQTLRSQHYTPKTTLISVVPFYLQTIFRD